jgi:hypothetical protein
MSVDGMGTQEFSGVMVDGNSVNFSSAIDAGGQSITLTFNGLIDGDTISGAFDSDFGAFDVSGSRQ